SLATAVRIVNRVAPCLYHTEAAGTFLFAVAIAGPQREVRGEAASHGVGGGGGVGGGACDGTRPRCLRRHPVTSLATRGLRGASGRVRDRVVGHAADPLRRVSAQSGARLRAYASRDALRRLRSVSARRGRV